MQKRHLVALLAATGAAGTGAAPASAEIIELGASPFAPLVAPTCPVGVAPANCTIILTQVTAMETIRAGTAYPTTIKKNGYIVAITLGLSRLDPNAKQAAADVQFLNASYGGGPQIAVTVLKPVHQPRLRRWKVDAESPPIKLQPYLGEVAQFPLAKPLRVKPTEVVAITVPTWAPVLTFGLNSRQYAYRQSRTGTKTTPCSKPPATNQAQTVVNAVSVAYACDYPGTRVEYTATEITTPLPVCTTASRTTTTTTRTSSRRTTSRTTMQTVTAQAATTRRTTSTKTSTTATCTPLS